MFATGSTRQNCGPVNKNLFKTLKQPFFRYKPSLMYLHFNQTNVTEKFIISFIN